MLRFSCTFFEGGGGGRQTSAGSLCPFAFASVCGAHGELISFGYICGTPCIALDVCGGAKDCV